MHGLAPALLALVDPRTRQRLEQLPDLDALLRSFLSVARLAWPTIELADEAFLRYLAAHLPADEPFERALRNLCVDELYLCSACAAGDNEAVSLFRERYGRVIRSALNALRLGEATTEEVEQALLARLLSGSPEQPAMITTYGGYGRLARWLRVVAARTGRALLEREKKLVLVGDERIAAELASERPDLDSGSKQAYREVFKRAFKHALGTLQPRELNLLRQRYVDNLGLVEIGTIYRVHHTTAHRWLENARAALLERTCAHMREALQVSEQDCESILRLIQSNLDITLHTFLSGGKQTP